MGILRHRLFGTTQDVEKWDSRYLMTIPNTTFRDTPIMSKIVNTSTGRCTWGRF